ncbi:FitA-like ribbon-helix-helix domain-containing protein [Halomonas sp. C05BenzN]|uniref:FitA-like ribbon-helix-helix domain-containing protein n=1 Tax=Halomonas sp. C05BenzN TaxID=3411041 RepID=UPI003B94B372
MATITIRNLDDDLKAELRLAAARHGHSMEEEVRTILRRALSAEPTQGLGSRIRQRFAAEGGVELELPSRKQRPRVAEFEE